MTYLGKQKLRKHIFGPSLSMILAIGLASCSPADVASSADKEQVSSRSDVKIMRFPDKKIETKTDAVKPDFGIIYMLDLNVSGNIIAFSYIGYLKTELSQANPRREFEDILGKVVKGPPYPTPALPAKYKWKKLDKRCPKKGHQNPTFKCPWADTDLSATNKDKSFVAFVLNPQKNWTFIDEEDDENPGGVANLEDPITRWYNSSDNYSNVRKMRWDSIGNKYHTVDQDIIQKDTRAVYFTANGPQAFIDGDYRDYFNLYVEVHSMDGSGTKIPIVIDPDVGYPGGNDGG